MSNHDFTDKDRSTVIIHFKQHWVEETIICFLSEKDDVAYEIVLIMRKIEFQSVQVHLLSHS